MLFLIFGLTVLYIIYIYLLKPQAYWKRKNILYVSPWSSYFSLFFGKKSFFQRVVDAYRRFPDKRYYGSYQFLTPALFVQDLDLIKQITVKDFDYFPDHFNFMPRMDPVLDLNLFALTGDRWKDMRSTLSPAFTSSKMRSMYSLIQDTAEKFVDNFWQKTEAGDVIVVEMKTVVSKFTNDVIANCAFGVECDSLHNENNEFFKMGTEITTRRLWNDIKGFLAVFCPKLFMFFKMTVFPPNTINFFRTLVKKTTAHRDKNAIIRPDMIHLLMEARKGRLKHDQESPVDEDAGFATAEESSIGKTQRKMEITDDVMTAQVLVFFFAGFATSSTLLSFLSHHLAVDQTIQYKLRREIDRVLGERSGKITYGEILKMTYLDQVISEALRMYPPGYVLSRVCAKDYLIKAKNSDEKDLLLDKNTVITIPVCGIHMDPQYFSDPEKFDPERFSDENRGKIIAGSYMPFGYGPRNCIGSRFALLECKALVVSLLEKFEIVPVKKTLPLVLSKSLELNSFNGFWVGLRKRNL